MNRYEGQRHQGRDTQWIVFDHQTKMAIAFCDKEDQANLIAAALCAYPIATGTPVFVHDCEHCTFLGNYQDDNGTYDLYHCVQGGRIPTVIARFGNGENYLSGLNSELPALKEAQKRAKAKGLQVEYKFH